MRGAPDFPHCHSEAGALFAEDQLRCPQVGPGWGTAGCLGGVLAHRGVGMRGRNVRSCFVSSMKGQGEVTKQKLCQHPYEAIFCRLRSSGLILEQDRVQASPRSSSLRDELGKGGG